ncbi:MAG: hypothetical protein R3E32_13440 [Chitinophagales bacterium]
MPTLTKQSQTFRILRSFEEKEWQDFKDYFKSPFFFKPRGKEAVLPDVLDALYEYYMVFAKKDANGEVLNPNDNYLWEKLRQDGGADPRIINNWLSNLDRHLDIFFRYQWMKEDNSLEKGIWTLKYLHRRGLEDEFTHKYYVNKLKKFENKFHAAKEKSSSHWYHRFILEMEKSVVFKLEDNFKRGEYIKEGLKHLEFFYLHEKLKYIGLFIDRSKIVDANIEDLNLPAFLPYLEHLKPLIWNESPLFRLYYYLLMGLTEDDGNVHYEQLQKEFFEVALKIPLHERNNIRELIFNFLIRQINLGKSEYKRILYTFYVELLKRDFLLVQGKLGYAIYRNVVAIALDIGEWDWTKEFIEKYEKKLTPFHRAEDIYAYCQALLYVYRKEPDYATAISWLNKMTSKFIFFEIWRRTLLIICYYDTQESLTLPVEAEINNFKEYLRNKELKERILPYQNFARFISRILKTATFNKNKGKYIRLKKEIEEAKWIVHREWLLKKLEERGI